ncbi:MAG TPA: DMT family transporter [Acidimicrobiales bacterium]|nr:DMT family transporter [Acidimicrobiales bacterium]
MAVTAAERGSSSAVLAASSAVAVWGLGNVLVKEIALSGPSLSFDRLWVGFVFALALVAAFRRRVTWRTLWLSAPGGLSFGVNTALFFTAVKLAGVTDATIIAALQPALLLCVAGPLFGEKVTVREIGGTVLALGGTALVVLGPGHQSSRSLVGDLLAVAALLTWATYFVGSKRARRSMGTVEYQAAMSLWAAVVVTPVALVNGGRISGGWVTWLWVVVMVVGPGGGHFLMNWAHQRLPLSQASLLTLAIPVVAMAGAAGILGDRIEPVQIVGTALVLLSLAGVVTAGASPSRRVSRDGGT